METSNSYELSKIYNVTKHMIGNAETKDQIQYRTSSFYFNANLSNRLFILQAVSISNFPVSKFGNQ